MNVKILESPIVLSKDIHLKRPRYLTLLLYLLEKISLMVSNFYLFALNRNWIKVPSLILESPYNYKCTIREIWFSRILRRTLSLLVRSPLKKGTISLINNKLKLPSQTGCVIAIPHTPWSRLLAEWCKVNKFALVLVGGPWIKRTGSFNVPGGGFSGLKRTISHLRSGGCVIVIGDNIGRWRCCKIHFLGKDCFASFLPARIAESAGVPLLAIYPKFNDGMINIHNGFESRIEEIKADKQKVTQKVFDFFETEIRDKPSIYEPYVLRSLHRLSSNV